MSRRTLPLVLGAIAIASFVGLAVAATAWGRRDPAQQDQAGLSAARSAAAAGAWESALEGWWRLALAGGPAAESARQDLAALARGGFTLVSADRLVLVANRLGALPPDARLGWDDADLARSTATAAARIDNPLLAQEAFSVAAGLAPRDAQVVAGRLANAQACAAQLPGDPQVAGRLALARLAAGDLPGASMALQGTEGREGDGDAALARASLLALGRQPKPAATHYLAWLKPRLDAFQKAKSALESETAKAKADAEHALQSGAAGDAWYREQAGLPPEEGQRLRAAWIGRRTLATPEMGRAIADAMQAFRNLRQAALEAGGVCNAAAAATAGEEGREIAAAGLAALDAILPMLGPGHPAQLMAAEAAVRAGRIAEGRNRAQAFLEAHQRNPQARSDAQACLRAAGDTDGAKSLE